MTSSSREIRIRWRKAEREAEPRGRIRRSSIVDPQFRSWILDFGVDGWEGWGEKEKTKGEPGNP